MTGVTLLGNHYHDEYVAADGNGESDDSDDDGNDVWFSDPSQMLLSVGGKPPATSLYCQHQFCRKEEIHHFGFEIIWICDLDRRIKHVFSRSFGAKPPCQDLMKNTKLLI